MGGHPLSHCGLQSSHAKELGSKASLECREVCTDLNVDPAREDQNTRVEGSEGDSDVEPQDSREVLHPRTFGDSVTVLRSVPATSVTNVASSSIKIKQSSH